MTFVAIGTLRVKTQKGCHNMVFCTCKGLGKQRLKFDVSFYFLGIFSAMCVLIGQNAVLQLRNE